MAIEKLSDAQIDALLKKLPQWTRVGEAIQRTYIFPNFVTSMKFVDKVAASAEAAQHHPDILIRYSKVTLTLATHDANGITQKDFGLAAACDDLSRRLTRKPAQP